MHCSPCEFSTPPANLMMVSALDVLLENVRLTPEALNDISDVVITAGGDCGVGLAPISAARARLGAQLTALWFDDDPHVNTAQTLPSGAFHGMVLRTLLGDGPAALVPGQPLVPEQDNNAYDGAGNVTGRNSVPSGSGSTYTDTITDNAADLQAAETCNLSSGTTTWSYGVGGHLTNSQDGGLSRLQGRRVPSYRTGAQPGYHRNLAGAEYVVPKDATRWLLFGPSGRPSCGIDRRLLEGDEEST